MLRETMTEQKTRTHAIDINALSQGRKKARFESEDICISIEDLSLSYGQKQALHNIKMQIPRELP